MRIDGPATVQNRILSNTICAFDSEGIELVNGGNQNNSAPVIDGATSGTVSGSGEAGCAIELFRAEPRIGRGGSLKFAGAGMADGAGHWSITPVGLNAGDFLCALATDSLNNTSGFSNNFIVGFVSTATSSPTQTPTLTPSPVWTPTPTGTLPPACTATSTGTPFPTASPTASVTDSRTPGPGYTGDGVKAFPNPAHDSMTFVLKLERADEVTVTIYNLSGERIADLKTSNGPGTARLVWDCSRTAPGVYLACVKVGGTEKIKLKVARVK
ncbi:MAG: T9SS type A sorting domain-containing protein [Candidatus Firestonebacteria bacterium]|nr:T9SS type A sorting domain-containing protein [Candidatus Firestonebacteria bacterium]